MNSNICAGLRIGLAVWAAVWAAVIGVLATACMAIGAPVINSGFEEGPAGALPSGWSVPTEGFKAETVTKDAPEGKQCARLSRSGAMPKGFGNLMQSLDAAEFRGKQVSLSAMIRMERTIPGAQAQMWVRVDREGGEQGFFDNMDERPIRSAKWKTYTTLVDVAEDAATIVFGVLIVGVPAAVLVDDVKLEATGKPAAKVGELPAGSVAARPLSERGLSNVMAAARLAGYLRFFYPGSEAEGVAWDGFTLALIEKAEGTRSDEELAKVLGDAAAPIARYVQVWSGQEAARPAAALEQVPSADVTAWRNVGVQLDMESVQGRTTYSSKRVRERVGEAKQRGLMPAGTAHQREIAPGVWCRVPVTLYCDERGQTGGPNGAGLVIKPARPEGFVSSGADRGVRLSAVALMFNVGQHFFPYFGSSEQAGEKLNPVEVNSDWGGAFAVALRRAAADVDEKAFLDTLSEFVAALRDGHGSVNHPKLWYTDVLPLSWAWAEQPNAAANLAMGERAGYGQLVVTADYREVKRGDVVTSIGGVKVEALARELSTRISAATPAWRDTQLLTWLAVRPIKGDVELVVRSGAAGADRKVTVPTVGPADNQPKHAPFALPEQGAEIAPGVVYVDLNGLGNEALIAVMPKVVAAKAVVFDLRGYPGEAGFSVLEHLTTKSQTSLRMEIPRVVMPDRVASVLTGVPPWKIKPRKPHIDASSTRVVFLSGNGSISYCESVLSVVESLKLGTIIGQRTAGTNGDIIPFTLPGGYLAGFTGLRVTKDDGRTHHGVGVVPSVEVTVTAAGIKAGRDEVIEAAVKWISEHPAQAEPAEKPAAKPGDGPERGLPDAGATEEK